MNVEIVSGGFIKKISNGISRLPLSDGEISFSSFKEVGRYLMMDLYLERGRGLANCNY